jgi:prepilin-type N-terminal cleavage/methylation domain-containing protein
MKGAMSRRGGFTLIELLLVIAIVALLVGTMLPALGKARAAGRSAVCVSQMKQFGVATGTYAADYQDRIFAFSWKAGVAYSRWPELNNANMDVQAAANQAVDILRRRADREDMPRGSGWIPHVLYTHLVIHDYLAQRLPERMVVCPEDAHRLNWQIDPRNNYDKGVWLPYQHRVHTAYKRVPYSSSYQVVPATYDANPPAERLRPANYTCYFLSSTHKFGGRLLTEVQFPANKVHMMDSQQRHAGRHNLFYAVPRARQPLLMFDHSVNVYRTGDGNQGWQPQDPANPAPSTFEYQPELWEAPTSTGEPSEILIGHYRWTRGALLGVDFGAEEIDTGQKR